MDRKEQILKAASKVFDKYGLVKTKLDDIAKECGIKKTAVYYYFKNKDEIIQTMFLRDIKKIKSAITEEIKKQTSAIKKLQTYLYKKTESIRYMMKYFDLFMKEDAPLIHRELAFKEKKTALKEEVELLKKILKEGIKNKEFADVDIMAVVYLLTGSTYTLGLEDYFYRSELDIKNEANKIMKILLEGIKG